MKYKLIITEEAALEISVKYYESQLPGLGSKFLSHLEIYLKRIQLYPEHYQIKRQPYREAFIKKFPYLIIYEFTEGQVVVYAVFNTYRNPSQKP